MRVSLGAGAAVALLLTACAGAGQSGNLAAIVPPVSQGPGPRKVAINETPVAVEPLYDAVAADGSVYFGFGANGTGSPLYRYSGGAFTQTLPANPPSGDDPGGGVYGIDAQNGNVYWLSAYFGGPQYLPYVYVECGGDGGTASFCGPSVDEPTSMLVDSNGTFWLAGISANGGGEVVTGSGASFQSDTLGVQQIINGPGDAVWGIVQTISPQSSSIVRFGVSGGTIAIAQTVALPAGSMAGSMALGGDGDIWFTDYGLSKIGRITSAGSLTEFSSPHAIDAPQYGETQMATACDGTVWYTESSANAVVHVDGSGNATEYPLPSANGYPGPIASTPPGTTCLRTMWVGEVRASKLAAVAY